MANDLERNLGPYARIFRQLPRAAAAELVILMAEDDQLEGKTSRIMQAAVLASASNRLFGSDAEQGGDQ